MSKGFQPKGGFSSKGGGGWQVKGGKQPWGKGGGKGGKNNGVFLNIDGDASDQSGWDWGGGGGSERSGYNPFFSLFEHDGDDDDDGLARRDRRCSCRRPR